MLSWCLTFSFDSEVWLGTESVQEHAWLWMQSTLFAWMIMVNFFCSTKYSSIIFVDVQLDFSYLFLLNKETSVSLTRLIHLITSGLRSVRPIVCSYACEYELLFLCTGWLEDLASSWLKPYQCFNWCIALEVRSKYVSDLKVSSTSVRFDFCFVYVFTFSASSHQNDHLLINQLIVCLVTNW